MPTALDRNWSALLAALADNNIGAVTEVDLRAVAAYFRTSRFNLTFGDPGVNLSTKTWGILPTPYDGVNWLKVMTLFGSAASTSKNSSGRLASTSNGIQYTVGNVLDDGATQPRVFDLNWNAVIRSQYNSSWGLSFYKLLNGGTWPSVGGTWDPVGHFTPVHLATFSNSEFYTDGVNPVWLASENGSRQVELEPGESIVPVLEFYGTKDSTGSSPDGFIESLTVSMTSLGPTHDNEATAGSDANFDAVTMVAKLRDAAMYATDQGTSGNTLARVEYLETGTAPLTGNWPGRTIFEVSSLKMCVWTGAAWKRSAAYS